VLDSFIEKLPLLLIFQAVAEQGSRVECVVDTAQSGVVVTLQPDHVLVPSEGLFSRLAKASFFRTPFCSPWDTMLGLYSGLSPKGLGKTLLAGHPTTYHGTHQTNNDKYVHGQVGTLKYVRVNHIMLQEKS
jgi:hypothetical protein